MKSKLTLSRSLIPIGLFSLATLHFYLTIRVSLRWSSRRTFGNRVFTVSLSRTITTSNLSQILNLTLRELPELFVWSRKLLPLKIRFGRSRHYAGRRSLTLMIVYGSDARPLDSPAISFSLDARFAALAAAWLLRLWHFSTPLATHSRQHSGSSFTRDRPFILHVPRPLTTSRSRSRDQRRSRIRLLTLDDDDDDVVVAIERLIRRGHRGDQPLPEKTSSRLILPNIIFVEVSPPPLSDRESPPLSLLGQARSRSLRTLVRLAASLSLSPSLFLQTKFPS